MRSPSALVIFIAVTIFAGIHSSEAQDLVIPLPEEAWTGVAKSLTTEQEQSRALDEEMSAFLDTPQSTQQVDQSADRQKYIDSLLQTPSTDRVVPEMALFGGAYMDALAKDMHKAKADAKAADAAAIAAKLPKKPVAPVVHKETAAEKNRYQEQEYHTGMEDMAGLLGTKFVKKMEGDDALDAPPPPAKAPLTDAQVKANKKAEMEHGLALAKHMMQGLDKPRTWEQRAWITPNAAQPVTQPANKAAPQQAQAPQAMSPTGMNRASLPTKRGPMKKDQAQTNALMGMAQMALKNQVAQSQQARAQSQANNLKALHQATQQAQAAKQQAQAAYTQQMQRPKMDLAVRDSATIMQDQLGSADAKFKIQATLEMIQANKATAILQQKAAWRRSNPVHQTSPKRVAATVAAPKRVKLTQAQMAYKPVVAPVKAMKNAALFHKELASIPEGSNLMRAKQEAIRRALLLKQQQAHQEQQAQHAKAQLVTTGVTVTGPNGVHITGEHQTGHGNTKRVLPPRVNLPSAAQEAAMRAQVGAAQQAAQVAAATRVAQSVSRLDAAKEAEMAAQQQQASQQPQERLARNSTPFQGKNEQPVARNPVFQNVHFAKPKSVAEQQKQHEAIMEEEQNMYDDGAGAMLHSAGMDDAIKDKSFNLNDAKF